MQNIPSVNPSEHSQVYNQPLTDSSLIACQHCDLVQHLPDLDPGASARCPRCNKELWRRREDSLNRTLALTVAATVLYIVANSVPMLGLTIVGVLVLFTAVVAPGLQIGLMLAIVLGGMRKRPPRWVGTLLRHHPTTRI